MSILLSDLGVRCASAGAGVVGESIYYGTLPDTPDECVALVEYAGGEPTYTQESDLPSTESPRVQVTVRSRTHEGARERISTIYLALNLTNILIDGRFYQRIRPTSNPFLLRRDENDRFEFVVNLDIMRRLS